ncbi:hypothetical protein GCM10009092_21150 [Bowmanella denitrificans]|uniref:FHA domain-containing protein n=1 Tax=Bowmanella denitrificans TaxID=366582 RepID=A0ABN0X705_9ALTE
MAIIVEKLGGNNRQVKHFRFDQQQISIGRGYDNDIRLDDPYVCADHVLIEQDLDSGQIRISDKQSVNGLRVNGLATTQSAVTKQDVIVLGKTRLRIFDSAEQVDPALRLSVIESRLNFLSHWRFALLLGFVYALALTYQTYLNTFVEFELGKMLPRLISDFLILSAWPLLFGMLSRLQKQDARLASQYSIALIMVLIGMGLSLINQWIQFNYPQLPAWNLVELSVLALLLFVLFWLTLLIAFHQPTYKRNRIALGCSLILLSCIMGWQQIKQAEFTPRPVYQFILLPDSYALDDGMTTDQFIQSLQGSYADSAANRTKK